MESKPTRSRHASGSSSRLTGRLSITSKGFGFVRVEGAADVFVDLEHLDTAMHGDTVEVQLFARYPKGKPAGRVLRVLERSRVNIVGVFQKTADGGLVRPEDDRLPVALRIPRESLEQAGLAGKLRDGHVVAARLDQWPNRREQPTGSITQVVGRRDEPSIDLKIVALSNDLSLEFPREVLNQAEAFPAPNFRREAGRRLDLRKTACFTIDPPGAGDFDDALSVRLLSNGLFEVGVHIADVSHFVPEGSPLDLEARRRGNSVYFPRQVLPMLPERLSGDLCSLKPGQNRLAFSVIMRLDSTGKVREHTIAESIIRSSRRFTYAEAQRILEGRDDHLAGDLRLLHLLAQVLRRRREEDGSLDFDLPEPIIELDEEGIPRAIRPQERLEAHRLVEELMLLANRTVAAHAQALADGTGRPLPFIYRVHPTPQPEEVEALIGAVLDLGIPYRRENGTSSEDYRRILELIQNLDHKEFVEQVALRSLARAYYSTESLGHFGLAFEHYTHFTSPIRRYPDLVVHRLLKRYAKGTGGRKAGDLQELKDDLEEICRQSNRTERVATTAEREYRRLKSLEFLARRVGNVYDGVISGVASFGLFIQLSRYLVEGLVPVASLDGERYTYDEKHFRLVGEKSGRTFRLGDRVRVQVRRVSVAERQADFQLA